MRQIPIHQSLLRPNLLAGCERELILLLSILCACLVFGVGGKIGIGIGAGTWVAGKFALTALAKKDAQFRAIFTRAIHGQGYYPSSAHPDAPHRTIIE